MTKTKTKTGQPLRGAELLRVAVNHILEHPSEWDQSQWHCGTSHCVFGTCQIKAEFPKSSEGILEQIRDALGISDFEARWLSSPNRSLSQIYGFANAMLHPDRAGFDRAGFDSDGFDRDGFDRDGFDRAGFNSDGFNRAGFDRAGFDRAGFDRDGFNSDGFNRAGKRLPLL